MVEEVKFLTEDSTSGGPKDYYIEGIFMQAAKKNRNGRIYPKELLQREAARYMKNYINPNRAFGELGHPESPTINLDRVSHMVKNLTEDGNNFWGRAKILDTPYGKIVKNFIDEGAKLGVSTRGLGSLTKQSDYDLVQDDFFLAAIDVVADPSAADAMVQGILENKEWILEAGTWKEVHLIEAKKSIKTASRGQIESVKLSLFEDFLKGL